jgi:cell wall-associated NlpC family hydrolase
MHRLLKTAVATMSGIALTFTVTMASTAPAEAASGCKASYSSYKTIKKGTKGAQARSAECLLRSAGYRPKVNGSFTSADSAQLKRFQRSHHVNVTGKVYASSWTALLSRGSTPTLRPGSKGEAVKRLQNALTASGRHVSATGTYGSATTKAVKSVQRARKLKATGTANAAVWRLLQAGDPIVKKAAPKKKKQKVSKAGSSKSKGARALAFAKRQVGDRYRYGASGPNAWDCSGLTSGAWKSVGVKLPHSAKQQYRKGKKVSKSNLKPGDLVFFYSGISHVAIYAGKGKVVHASRPGKPVATVKMSYMPFKGARRVG